MKSPEEAVADLLGTLSLGVQVHNVLPLGQPKPYIVVHAPFTSPKDSTAAPHSGGVVRVVPELQVDVWQDIYGSNRAIAYDPALAEKAAVGLANAKLANGAVGTRKRFISCSVLDGPVTVNNPLEANVRHEVIHVQLRRVLAAA